jgi:hypothetical protein
LALLVKEKNQERVLSYSVYDDHIKEWVKRKTRKNMSIHAPELDSTSPSGHQLAVSAKKSIGRPPSNQEK